LVGIFALITAALVASCGGGGAATNTQGNNLNMSPLAGSIYAGVSTTFQVFGGRAPYQVSSSEPGLLPVPSQVNGNSFTVVAANPGVTDPTTDPLIVPSRTVIITVRDVTGQTVFGTYNVLQNFLTGYGVSFTPTACTGTLPTTTETGTVPAGCEVAVRFNATTSGNLGGDRRFRLDVIRGPFIFVDAVTGLTGTSIFVMSDHSGRVNAIIRTLSGQPTQIAVLRITELETGVFTDTVFTITGLGANATLEVIPDSITFTGADSSRCGTGDADVFVFDGSPPYSAVSTSPNVVVFAVDANSNPGIFRVRAVNPNVCVTATVIITDRFGARATVTVTTEPGTSDPAAPPTPPVAATPTTITLGCGQSGSVTITGGTPPYSGSSADPNVTVAVTGSTATITRRAIGGTAPGTVQSTVNVTDGATVASVVVNNPGTCP
jgi:hypothetical protein